MPIFKSHLYQLAAYKPPLDGRDPHKHLLLDFNERTLPVSAPVCDALTEYIRDGRLQMYPSYGDIVQRLADYAGTSADNVMITNGSDQGIELVFRACGREGHEAVIPQPNFAMYQQCAQIENMRVIMPFYSQEDGLPEQEIIAAVNDATRVICIANPNNPSGQGCSRESIIRIAEAAPNACILVDECYFEYSKTTAVDLITRFPNIVITRTFSKTWGLPSLRFGYLMAAPENIAALLSVRGPYDVNQLAVVAAQAALEHPEYTEQFVDEVMMVSKPLLEAFFDGIGVNYWPSAANYLWAFPENPGEVEKHLKSAGILVRPKADAQGSTGLRITLGNKGQTERLIDVLKVALGV